MVIVQCEIVRLVNICNKANDEKVKVTACFTSLRYISWKGLTNLFQCVALYRKSYYCSNTVLLKEQHHDEVKYGVVLRIYTS